MIFQIWKWWATAAGARQSKSCVSSRQHHATNQRSSGVRYAKSLSIWYFIDIDIWQNFLIDIDININIFKIVLIDIFQKCRYIDNRYFISIYRTPPDTSQRPFETFPKKHLFWREGGSLTFENLQPWGLGMWSGFCLEESPISCSDGLDFNSGINISRWARLPGSPDTYGKHLGFVNFNILGSGRPSAGRA